MIKKTLCSILAGLSLISCGDNSTRSIESPDAGIQFVCKDNDTKTEKCGLNNRGTLEYVCQNNQWLKGNCVDSNVCIDDSTQIIECGDVCIGKEEDKCVKGQWQKGTCEELTNISNTPDFYYNNIDFDDGLVLFTRNSITNPQPTLNLEYGFIDISNRNKITIFDSLKSSGGVPIGAPIVKNNKAVYVYYNCNSFGGCGLGSWNQNNGTCNSPWSFRVAKFNQDHSMLIRYDLNQILPPNVCLDGPWQYYLFDSNMIFTAIDATAPFGMNIYLYDFNSNSNKLILSDWYNSTKSCHGSSRVENNGNHGYLGGFIAGVFNGFITIGSLGDVNASENLVPPICISDLNSINFQPIPIQGINPHFDSGVIDFEVKASNSSQREIMSYRPKNGYNRLGDGYSLSDIGEGVGNSFSRIGMSQNRHLYGNNVATTNADGSKICKQILNPSYNFNYQNGWNLRLSNDKIVGVKDDSQVYMCKLRPCTNWEDADISYFP